MPSHRRSNFQTRSIVVSLHHSDPAWKSKPASRSSKTHETRPGRSRLVLKRITVFSLCLVFIFNVPAFSMQAASESTLASVRRSDASNRDAKGKLQKLPPAEHMRRAAVYLSVRAFAEARDHWQTLIENYPGDQRVPAAMR